MKANPTFAKSIVLISMLLFMLLVSAFNSSAKTVTIQYSISGQQTVNNIYPGDSIFIVNATGTAQTVNVAVDASIIVSAKNVANGGVIYAFQLSTEQVVDVYNQAWSIIAKYVLNTQITPGYEESMLRGTTVTYSNNALQFNRKLTSAWVEIFDLNGKLVEVISVSENSLADLNFPLPAGIYVYKAHIDMSLVLSGRFFKQ